MPKPKEPRSERKDFRIHTDDEGDTDDDMREPTEDDNDLIDLILAWEKEKEELEEDEVNLDEPWIKWGDKYYLDDANDREFVRRWPYRLFRTAVHIAVPHRNKKKLFKEKFAICAAEVTGREPEDFEVEVLISKCIR